MKKRYSCILVIVLVLFTLALTHGAPVFAGRLKTVAVLPFTMNADRDLTFLQEGIMDMLAVRLAWKDEVEVLEKDIVKKRAAQFKGPINTEKAILIGEALKVDYVILGSLTVFGESVSMDARIIDMATKKTPVTAFNQSKGMDEVIPTVNQFAQDINAKIMGREVIPPGYATRPGPRGPGGLIAGGDLGFGEVALSRHFRVEIVSLDTGDVDGDGGQDLVFVTYDKVHIYRWLKKGFSLFKTIKHKWSPNHIYVSVGDMDGNGKAEIYVSNLTQSRVSSYVLEWAGNGFKRTADGLKWLLKVVDIPGQGRKLIGQERALDSGYKGAVQFLKREGDHFVSEGPLSLPRGGNVFNFVIGRFDKTPQTYTIMLNPYERLQVFDQENRQMWVSEGFFGGSLTFMEDKEPRLDRMGATATPIYIPPPIFLMDVDDDEKPEVVICKNHSRVGRYLEHMRFFSSGKVYFMAWAGLGLSPKWTSQKVAGAVVGYAVADIDHDGKNELIMASVTKEEKVIGKARSRIVVYDLK